MGWGMSNAGTGTAGEAAFAHPQAEHWFVQSGEAVAFKSTPHTQQRCAPAPARPAGQRTCGLPPAPLPAPPGSWPSNSVNTFSSRACKQNKKEAAPAVCVSGLQRQAGRAVDPRARACPPPPSVRQAAAERASRRMHAAGLDTRKKKKKTCRLTRKCPPTNTKSVPCSPAPGPPLAPEAAEQGAGRAAGSERRARCWEQACRQDTHACVARPADAADGLQTRRAHNRSRAVSGRATEQHRRGCDPPAMNCKMRSMDAPLLTPTGRTSTLLLPCRGVGADDNRRGVGADMATARCHGQHTAECAFKCLHVWPQRVSSCVRLPSSAQAQHALWGRPIRREQKDGRS